MSVETGLYSILTTGYTLVGRSEHEILGVSPKSVSAKTEDPQTKWIVERLTNGKYSLSIGGSPTADEKGFFIALLIERRCEVEWQLDELEPGLVRIKDPNTGLPWTAPSFEKSAKIELRPFITGSPVETQAFNFGIFL